MKLKNVIIEDDNLFEKSGTSGNGKEWKYKLILVKTQDKYPSKIVLQLWGNLANATLTLSEYDFDIVIDSREYNGKWYTDIKVISFVESIKEPKHVADDQEHLKEFNPDPIEPIQKDIPAEEEKDQLPF